MANTLVIANYSRGLSSGLAVRLRQINKFEARKYRSKKYRLCVAAGVALFLVLRVDYVAGQDQDQKQSHNSGLANFFKRSDQRAVDLLEEGRYEQAAAEFDNPQWRGVSKYRDGKYKEAMEDFAVAEDATGLYNHGTAAVRAGDYTQAVSSFEKALALAPDNADISHNLEIAKKLRDLVDQQQQEQPDNQQGGEQSESQDSENSDQSESEDSQNGEDGSDESTESQTDDSQADDGQNDSSQGDASDSENNGEMNAEADSQSTEQQEQDAQALREMMQQEQQTDDAEQQEQQSEAVAGGSAPSPLSEDDQATEQWLRRIPDDGSQLLRNKIRLNHLIEYPDVQDMQEPW